METTATLARARPAAGALRRGPGLRRAALLLAVLAGAGAGASGHAASPADDLARLLRFMALLKASMVLAALGVVAWRLAEPVSPPRLAAYLGAAAAAAAGPGLIWNMAHLGLGALLLHGGLAALLLMLWRDPGAAACLEAALDRRRRALRRRGQPQRGGGSGKASTPPV